MRFNTLITHPGGMGPIECLYMYGEKYTYMKRCVFQNLEMLHFLLLCNSVSFPFQCFMLTWLLLTKKSHADKLMFFPSPQEMLLLPVCHTDLCVSVILYLFVGLKSISNLRPYITSSQTFENYLL